MKNCRFCSFKIMTVEYRPPLCVWCIRMNLKMNFKEPVYLQHISVYRSDTMLHISKPLFLKKIPKRVYNTWRKLSTGSCLADACSPESMWFVCCHLFLPNTMYSVCISLYSLGDLPDLPDHNQLATVLFRFVILPLDYRLSLWKLLFNGTLYQKQGLKCLN